MIKQGCLKHSGYTIIEVLIATAIFTSMLMLSTAALQQGLNQYKKVMDEGIKFWSYAENFWINRSFSGIFDYYVNYNSDWFPYFSMDGDRISYVTYSALANDAPVAAWIVKEKMKNAFGYSVVYYELPVLTKGYDDIEKDYTSKSYKKGARIVLFENVSFVDFQCFAIEALSWSGRWLHSYNAKDGKMLPEKIKISFQKDRKKLNLTFSIYNNSTIKKRYTDL
ncbi:prepilin-type [Candidatus Magnetoovum chiemensis]|nr:prepilin-type [Candidatus Magnetoovum chiemensis]